MTWPQSKGRLYCWCKALKPSSGDIKHIREKLEPLSKDHAEKGGEQVVLKMDKAKERADKGKGKAKEPQKKRKL